MDAPPTDNEYNHYASLIGSLYNNQLERVRAVRPDRWTGEPSSSRHVAYMLGKYLELVNWDEFIQYSCSGSISKKTLDNIWQGWCAKGNKHQTDIYLNTIDKLNNQIKQKDDEIIQQAKQIKQQHEQIEQLSNRINQQNIAQKKQEKQILYLSNQVDILENDLIRLSIVENDFIQMNKQTEKHCIQIEQQNNQMIDFKKQIAEQKQIICNLSTQMIGIQPDLIQLSDLYHEQEHKSIQLETELQYKNNQLTEQEDNIKQLLAALDSTQSKQGLVSTISRYFN